VAAIENAISQAAFILGQIDRRWDLCLFQEQARGGRLPRLTLGNLAPLSKSVRTPAESARDHPLSVSAVPAKAASLE
jgi:hypothetical protein